MSDKVLIDIREENITLSIGETKKLIVYNFDELENFRVDSEFTYYTQTTIDSTSPQVHIYGNGKGEGRIVFNADNASEKKTIIPTVNDKPITKPVIKVDRHSVTVTANGGSEVVNILNSEELGKINTKSNAPGMITASLVNNKTINISGYTPGKGTVSVMAENADSDIDITVTVLSGSDPGETKIEFEDDEPFKVEVGKKTQFKIRNFDELKNLNILQETSQTISSINKSTKSLDVTGMSVGSGSITIRGDNIKLTVVSTEVSDSGEPPDKVDIILKPEHGKVKDIIIGTNFEFDIVNQNQLINPKVVLDSITEVPISSNAHYILRNLTLGSHILFVTSDNATKVVGYEWDVIEKDDSKIEIKTSLDEINLEKNLTEFIYINNYDELKNLRISKTLPFVTTILNGKNLSLTGKSVGQGNLTLSADNAYDKNIFVIVGSDGDNRYNISGIKIDIYEGTSEDHVEMLVLTELKNITNIQELTQKDYKIKGLNGPVSDGERLTVSANTDSKLIVGEFDIIVKSRVLKEGLWINDKEYDFDGKISANFQGKNKSSLKVAGVVKMEHYTDNQILDFPLYSKVSFNYQNTKNKDKVSLGFEGIVKESIPANISNKYALKPMKLEAYDFGEFLTNGILLSKSFKKVEPKEIVDWVVSQLNDSGEFIFTLDSKISFGINEKINSWSIQDASPYDIFNELSNRTNSRFWLDENTIYFKSWEKMVEQSVDTLEINYVKKENEGKELVPQMYGLPIEGLIDLEYNGSSSFGYANYVVVRSKSLFSDQTINQLFRCRDGQLTFNLDFNVGQIKEVWLFQSALGENGLWKKIFWRESKWTTDPYNQYWEIKYTQDEKTLEYNEKLDKLSNTDTLYVEYWTISKGSSIQANGEEIRRIQGTTGYGDGRIAYIESKDDITSQRDLDNYAFSILDKMSTPRKDYYLRVAKDLGWRVNQIIMIKTQDGEEPYVVESIDWNHLLTPQLYEYSYTLTNTKNDNQTINFYDNRLKSDENNEEIFLEEVIDASLILNVDNYDDSQKHQDKFLTLELSNNKVVFENEDGDTLIELNIPKVEVEHIEMEVSIDGE